MRAPLIVLVVRAVEKTPGNGSPWRAVLLTSKALSIGAIDRE
ncbi:hypothetical protein [Metapseudomonas sp. CR1201]